MSIKTDIAHKYRTDPRITAIGTPAALTHVMALLYCGEHLTDGFIGRSAARTLYVLDEDDPFKAADTAIETLVAAGLWEMVAAVAPRPKGYRVVGYLKSESVEPWNQLSAEATVRQRGEWSENNDRKRHHDRGDHSRCDRCKVIKARQPTDRKPGVTGPVNGPATVPVTRHSSSSSSSSSSNNVRGSEDGEKSVPKAAPPAAAVAGVDLRAQTPEKRPPRKKPARSAKPKPTGFSGNGLKVGLTNQQHDAFDEKDPTATLCAFSEVGTPAQLDWARRLFREIAADKACEGLDIVDIRESDPRLVMRTIPKGLADNIRWRLENAVFEPEEQNHG